MNRQHLLSLCGFLTFVILLFLELTLRYDSWVRQIALALTDILSLLTLLIVRRYMNTRGHQLPWAVVWLVALGVWFDGMGNFLHFYANISWWDNLAHAVGTGALAAGIFVLVQMFQNKGTIVLGPKLRAVFVISVTTTLSAIYEITEYIGDTIYPTNRITGIFDTASDLMWNFLAAVVVAFAATQFSKRKRPEGLSQGPT